MCRQIAKGVVSHLAHNNDSAFIASQKHVGTRFATIAEEHPDLWSRVRKRITCVNGEIFTEKIDQDTPKAILHRFLPGYGKTSKPTPF